MTSDDDAYEAAEQNRMAASDERDDYERLSVCCVCDRMSNDTTTCAVCVASGDPAPYCSGCVRECSECKESVCFEHTGHASTRCVECIRRDGILSGDQA